MEYQYVELVQYIPSVTFAEISKHKIDYVFATAYSKGRERLFDIGRLLALDTLVNYGERFPLIWESTKAKMMDNIIFELEESNSDEADINGMYAINSKVNCLKEISADTQAQTVNYLSKLEHFIDEVFTDCKNAMKNNGEIDLNSYKFQSISPLKAALQLRVNTTGLMCLEIIFGIIIGYYNIVGMGVDRIERMLNRAKLQAVAENKISWNEQISKSVDIDYFREAFDLINHHLQLNIEAIGWVMKVSNNYKVIEVFDMENEEIEQVKMSIDESYLIKDEPIITAPEPEMKMEKIMVTGKDNENNNENQNDMIVENMEIVPEDEQQVNKSPSIKSARNSPQKNPEKVEEKKEPPKADSSCCNVL